MGSRGLLPHRLLDSLALFVGLFVLFVAPVRGGEGGDDTYMGVPSELIRNPQHPVENSLDD